MTVWSTTQPRAKGPTVIPARIWAETIGSLNLAKIRLKIRAETARMPRSRRNAVSVATLYREPDII